MSDVSSPVVIGEFEHDDHAIEVVWLPQPNYVVIQIAGSGEAGLLPFEIFAYVTDASSPRLERNALYSGQWPPVNSEAEAFVMARAIEIYEAEVSAEHHQSGQKRPAVTAG